MFRFLVVGGSVRLLTLGESEVRFSMFLGVGIGDRVGTLGAGSGCDEAGTISLFLTPGNGELCGDGTSTVRTAKM